MAALRVVFAEDGELLRAGVQMLLAQHDAVDVVATVGSFPELVAAVDAHRPDVVLTDVRMPPTLTDEGIRAANELRHTHPGLGVVVLTQYADVEYALDLVGEGSAGRGYLLKERVGDVDELVEALRTVQAGGSVIDHTVVEALVSAGRRHEHSPLARLTGREQQVLELVARGMTNVGIAEQLVIGERAVEKHINSIFAKLDLPPDSPLHRRVAAALLFLSEAGVGGTARGPAV